MFGKKVAIYIYIFFFNLYSSLGYTVKWNFYSGSNLNTSYFDIFTVPNVLNSIYIRTTKEHSKQIKPWEIFVWKRNK